MSSDTLNPEFGADQHPDETQLLLALERELEPSEAAAVERHIGTCWDCRARYHEMHRGILAFVEYRDKIYLPELEPAPHDFRQFPLLLNKAVAEGPKVSMLDRIGTRVHSFLRLAQIPLRVRWVTATALIMTVLLLWTQVFSPSSISASELLIKAAQSQNPVAAVHHKVRQKVRVKSGGTESVREFQWDTGGPIPGATWGTDPENWTAPMTAEGFSEWHDSLSAPKDKVKKSRDRWTLDTVAPAGPIKEASIVIHAGDFHPIEQHIRFSDDRRVDIWEISFEMAEQTPAVSTSAATQSAEPPVMAQSQPAAPSPATNLDEVELELRYAMFVERLDTDEDLQISRAADAVVMSGIASSAERLRQVQDVAARVPGARVSVSAPALPVSGTASAPSAKPVNSASIPLLKDRLDSTFASAEALREFVDKCLSASDSAVSDAWALKRLSERYTDGGRQTLKPESRAKLDEMMRRHLEQIAAANANLSGVLDLLPPARTGPPEPPVVNLRSGIAALFDLVQRQDSLVAALLARTQTTDTVAIAADNFRAGHEAIARLARELKPGEEKAPK
jgi:hypothetical protein